MRRIKCYQLLCKITIGKTTDLVAEALKINVQGSTHYIGVHERGRLCRHCGVDRQILRRDSSHGTQLAGVERELTRKSVMTRPYGSSRS